MRSKILIPIILSITAAALLIPVNIGPAGGRGSEGRISAVCTITIVADVVKNVGGDRVDVYSIVPLGGDPHIFQPTPSDAELVEKADIVFYVGLGLEHWLTRLVENLRQGSPLVRLSDGLRFRVDERTGEPDPHVWMDPTYVIQWAGRIADALSTLDPENRGYYQSNAARYIAELEELDSWIKTTLETIPPQNRKLITSHDAFRYFGDRYGFKIIGTVWGITTDEEPSATLVSGLIEMIRREGVPSVFIETTINPQILRSVAEQAGVSVGGPLYGDSLGRPGSGAETYIGMMKTNTAAIVSALREARENRGQEDGETTTLLDLLITPLRFEFMRRALLVALIIGVVGGVVGSYAILRGWALLGDAVSHSVLPGVAIAYVLGLDLFLGALGAGLASAIGIGVLERKTRIKRDAVLGIVFTAAFALGIALISAIRSVAVDLLHILFGNILAVSIYDMLMTSVAGAIVLAIIVILYRELMIYSFDPVLAHSFGLRATILHYLLMGLMTLAIVVSLRSVGVVLVVAMLITPASTAYLISKRLNEMMAKAAVIGGASAVIGLYLSYYLNIASGAAMVIVAAAIFASTATYKNIAKHIKPAH
ncbi:Manganese transport system membrane protein MntB [archaeon HR01]|nr:Manganese transport system membrane protein MntB [archaeon HR01]